MSNFTIPIRSDKLQMSFSVKETLYDQQTEFQQVTILDTEVFGKALLLDGHIQLTEFDEKAYHECLVQIPALNLESPKRALVIGGGDGGVIRELCRIPSIEHIDMVEIDPGVVSACQEWMPSLNDGAFENPKVHLHLTDAFQFVLNLQDQYELIIVDSTDTYEEEEGEISEMLWTEDFYRDIARVLAPNGFVVTQADNHVFCPYSTEEVHAAYRRVFAQTGFYFGLVPSFGGYSGFVWGSHGETLRPEMPATQQEFCYLNPTSYQLAFCQLQFGTFTAN